MDDYATYYRGGQKFEEGEYVDGMKQGIWKMWHDNGQIAKEENYVDGKLDGHWTLFKPDSVPERDVSYKLASAKAAGCTTMKRANPANRKNIKTMSSTAPSSLVSRRTKKSRAAIQEWRMEGTQIQWHPNGQMEIKPNMSPASGTAKKWLGMKRESLSAKTNLKTASRSSSKVTGDIAPDERTETCHRRPARHAQLGPALAPTAFC